jgi:CMP-N-acetylneuraminic acid synthetase
LYKNKTFLGIIPARGGSKGLKRKNIKILNNKPLIQWSIDIAKKSNYIDTLMVSTEDKEIAEVARKCNLEIPFFRPTNLADDTTSSFDVVKNILEKYHENFNKTFDYIILIEPTSPLREIDDIDNMIEKLLNCEDEYDAIISIGETNEHPSIQKRINNNKLEPFCKELLCTTRRQDDEKAYFPFGVAYIVKTEAFLKEKTFYPNKSLYFEIKRYQCYEIDDIYDFLAIENIMKYEWELK